MAIRQPRKECRQLGQLVRSSRFFRLLPQREEPEVYIL